VQGVVLLFEAGNGSLAAIADAHAITALRTAAASAVATRRARLVHHLAQFIWARMHARTPLRYGTVLLLRRLLARPDASRLALLGSGTQAKMHLDAISAVRPITAVTVWSRNTAHAEAFARTHRCVDDSQRSPTVSCRYQPASLLGFAAAQMLCLGCGRPHPSVTRTRGGGFLN
jgi:ornithine cyclodeaminase/alanine dehydrogenase-like protein (mu-crystallin family)